MYCKNINTKSAHSKINYELSALLKIKKVSNTNIIIKKKPNPQVINIKYELSMPNKLKKVTNASKNVIAFLNKHITRIIKGNKVHTHNEINNTVTTTVIHNIEKPHAKSAIPINKVHIENNTAGNTSKKTHKKLFKKVLKQIKTFNKVQKHGNIFDYDKCKKLHQELFNKVFIELLSTNNAGHKDSSVNINKIKKIEKALSEHNKHILTSLNKNYSDNRVKLSEFKTVND